MLESGVLANKEAAAYLEENAVTVIGQPGNKHDKVKRPHPEKKGEERDVCSKYGLPCSVHLKMNSDLREFFNLKDVKTVPYGLLVNPHAFLKKAPSGQTAPDTKMVDVIARWSGEFTTLHIKRAEPDVKKAMPGKKTSLRTYEDYREAVGLLEEGKLKEAEALFKKVANRKDLSPMLEAAVQKQLQELQAKVAKG